MEESTALAVAESADTPEQQGEPEKTPQGWAKYWDKEIKASLKRQDKFRTRGVKIDKRFRDDRDDPEAELSGDSTALFRLNIFHANVTTMLSMLCGSLPQVEVAREWHDPNDDVARVASLLTQRMLQVNIDYDNWSFNNTLKAALQDRLLPGIGVGRVRYTFEGPPENPTREDAPIEYVHWKDFLWSYSRVWDEVWWVAYRAYMTKKEAAQRFGEALANQLEYEERTPGNSDDGQSSGDRDSRDSEEKAEVWEIWDSRRRMVFWYGEGCDQILDEKPDPLGLQSFFPSPIPMFATITTSQTIPVADFIISQDLYNEVDELQSRISIITEAVKVVGVYDEGAASAVGRIFKEGMENDLIPVSNWAMFGEREGLKGVIDWLPVEEVVNTLSKLRELRDETIALLYEVTGLSDILRGYSDQYSGVGQDQLKAKFASIRVQAVQDDFARFASDLQTLKAEVISKHFSPESIAEHSNARYIDKADGEYVIQAINLMKQPQVQWRITIRPESIAQIDYAQMQAERGNFLNAVSTYIQSAQAMIKEVPSAGPMLIQLLKWGMAGFRGSKEIEGSLDKALDEAQKAAQEGQGKEDPTKGAAQVEKMKHQHKMQQIQAENKANLAEIQAQAQADVMIKQAEAQLSDHKAQQELQKENLEHQNAIKQLIAEFQTTMAEIQAKFGVDVNIEQVQAELDSTVKSQEHTEKMDEIALGTGSKD